MSKEFDDFWEQGRLNFVDSTPPLKRCGNCGAEIISTWEHLGEVLLLHKDKTMCLARVEDV